MLVKKIKKNIAKSKTEMYYSTIGSIIVACCMLHGFNSENTERLYVKLKKLIKDMKQEVTIESLVLFVWRELGRELGLEADGYLRSYLVLVTDNNGVRRPMVGLVDEEGHILPNTPDGMYTGILASAAENASYVQVEYIFDEDGEIINDAETS